jgi:MFS family permease
LWWFDLGKLWNHRNFRRLWLSDTVSLFGNTFTGLALPTIAVLTFNATTFEIGALVAVGFLPYPLLSLFVGVWADRWRRRRIMVAANLGRMLVLGSIPIAFLFGSLSLIQIFLVAGVNGILSVFFDISYQAYLPVLVDREDLVEGNQKLQISASGAQVAGPGIAGLVYDAIGGAFTIAFDALGYLASALSLISIDREEEKKERNLNDPPPDFFGEMSEGAGVVFGNPILVRIAGCTATSNLGTNMIQAVYLIFAYDQLHLSPAIVGFVGTVGALGFVVGVLLSRRVTARLGVGVTLAVSIASGFIALANPLALNADPFLVLATVGFFTGVLIPPYNITQVSLRQAITPDRLQGRMNATMRTIVWGTIPVGSIIGGELGVTIGVVNTLYVGAIVSGLAVLWILLGPVIRVREQPKQVEEEAAPFIPIPESGTQPALS